MPGISQKIDRFATERNSDSLFADWMFGLMTKGLATQKDIPMSILSRVFDAASDAELSATDIRTLAYVARYSDETGAINTDDEGRTLADPRVIAPAIHAGTSSVSRSLTHLERRGYLIWTRRVGRLGTLRIVIPTNAQA